MLRLAVVFWVTTIVGLSSLPAAAATRIFDFTARIDQVNTLYETGTVFRGSFSYDDELAPTFVFPTGTGKGAVYNSSLINFSFAILGDRFDYGGSAIVFDETTTGGDPDAFSISGRDTVKAVDLSFSIYGGQNNITMFNSIGLPTVFPHLLWQGPFTDPGDDDELTVPSGDLFYFDRDTGVAFSSLILEVKQQGIGAAVPEPATWAMMVLGFGLAGVGVRQRRSLKMSDLPVG